MKKYFITISDMCVIEELPPLIIVHKIMKYHIKPMNKVFLDTNLRILCLDSKGLKSGYKPYRWEISRAKDGMSEHTFGQGKKGKINLLKKGAACWRCDEFQLNKEKLIKSIIENTNYTRVVIYNCHVYTDYKNTNGSMLIYKSNIDNNWILINKIKLCGSI